MTNSADRLSTAIDKIPALTRSWLADGRAQDPNHVEEILPASDLHFRQIVDAISVLIVMNAAGELELINRQASHEYFGKTVEELRN